MQRVVKKGVVSLGSLQLVWQLLHVRVVCRLGRVAGSHEEWCRGVWLPGVREHCSHMQLSAALVVLRPWSAQHSRLLQLMLLPLLRLPAVLLRLRGRRAVRLQLWHSPLEGQALTLVVRRCSRARGAANHLPRVWRSCSHVQARHQRWLQLDQKLRSSCRGVQVTWRLSLQWQQEQRERKRQVLRLLWQLTVRRAVMTRMMQTCLATRWRSARQRGVGRGASARPQGALLRRGRHPARFLLGGLVQQGHLMLLQRLAAQRGPQGLGLELMAG